MTSTARDLKQKKALSPQESAEPTRSLGFGKTLDRETQSPSIQLSKDLAGSLMNLIRDVNKEVVTPESVNASCNCAAQIYKILRLNFEMKKEGF